ncbi:putative sugar kinase [uncultured archaeon]|nr:putative sugar kinase [uncultured archaeon]
MLIDQFGERRPKGITTDKKFDIVCFGNPTVDTIIIPTDRLIRPGGAAMNTAATFAGLGGRTGIIGRIGTDRNGNFLLQKLDECKIDITRVRVTDQPTFTNDIMVSSNERNIVHTAEYHGVDLLNEDDFAYIGASRAMLVGLRNGLFTQCAEFAARKKIILYVSAHRYLEEKAKGNEHYLTQYPIEAIIGDEKEIETVKAHCAIGPRTPLVVTRGSQGSAVICEGVEMSAPIYKVEAVDPTGAGDAFAAGYMFADLDGMRPEDCLALGNACGAVAVTGYGAQQLITSAAVEALLKR